MFVDVIYRHDFWRLLKKTTSLVCTGGCYNSSYFSISPLPLLWNQCPLTALLGFPSCLLSKVSVLLHQKTPSRAHMYLCSSYCLCRSCSKVSRGGASLFRFPETSCGGGIESNQVFCDAFRAILEPFPTVLVIREDLLDASWDIGST